MRVCGVICEYNPFHNGHALHLRQARANAQAQWIVCVMSGCFTQRGEAAIVSKWTRAEMALRCGADVVLELPTLFAVRDAHRFALGGVSLLDALGIVTHLSFGSESGDLDILQAQAKADVDLSLVRKGLSEGMTLARARGMAQGLNAGSPNDTLAIEYLRALGVIGSGITPLTIRREGGGYHDKALHALASATAIRAALLADEDVYTAMPPQAYALLERLVQSGCLHPPQGLDTLLLATLRTMRPSSLAAIADVGEGLENRLLRAAQEAISRQTLITLAKCKRYTWSRLSRIATQAMLGITKQLAAQCPRPTYARLLGFRQEARPLLAHMKEASSIPIVTRAARYRQVSDPAFDLDIRATDLWTLGISNPTYRAGRTDLTHPMVMI